MRILKINARQAANLEMANRETGNVIVVPFCLEDREGVFVEYDHLDQTPVVERLTVEVHGWFTKHRERLGPVDAQNIIDAPEIPAREAH